MWKVKYLWRYNHYFHHLVILISETLRPDVCLYAKIHPIPPIFLGESFTISCVVYSFSQIENLNLEIFHISNNGIQTHLPTHESQSYSHHDVIGMYQTVIANASNTSIGEYVCKLHLNEYDMPKETSVWISEVKGETI